MNWYPALTAAGVAGAFWGAFLVGAWWERQQQARRFQLLVVEAVLEEATRREVGIDRLINDILGKEEAS